MSLSTGAPGARGPKRARGGEGAAPAPRATLASLLNEGRDPDYQRLTEPHPKHGAPVDIRVVKPYPYVFESDTKARWRGKALLELYDGEFRVPGGQSGVLSEIYSGRIRINEEPCEPTRVVQNGDRLSRLTHRHEPPVVYVPAEEMVVADDGDVVVLNKPSSMPVYPTGAYRNNSLLVIAARELGLKNLRPVHRLDRLTSGLLVTARSNESASLLTGALRRSDGWRVKKTYVARVRGKFPSTQEEWSRATRYEVVTQECGSAPEAAAAGVRWGGGEVTVSFPVSIQDHRAGICITDAANGKTSSSVFRFIRYDEESRTSIVRCEPVSGRTHQLRLHLSFMGFPIANDPNYGGVDEFTGQTTGGPDAPPPNVDYENDEEEREPVAPPLQLEPVPVAALEAMTIEERLLELEKNCPACRAPRSGIRRLGIYLHALRFQVSRTSMIDEEPKEGEDVESTGEARAYDWRTPLPHWANPAGLTAEEQRTIYGDNAPQDDL